jgi:hypothetical protein
MLPGCDPDCNIREIGSTVGWATNPFRRSASGKSRKTNRSGKTSRVNFDNIFTLVKVMVIVITSTYFNDVYSNQVS